MIRALQLLVRPWIAAFALASAFAPDAAASGGEDEGSLLASLLAQGLGFFDVGPQGPHCAGFRACDLVFLGIVGAVIVAVLRLRHATQRRRLDLARRMVERGLEPPAELLGMPVRNDLRRGLVLLATGAGLLAASLMGGEQGVSPAGLIPGFIGLGYLASHRFAGNRTRGGP
jgi:hypothetical protein